MHRLLVALLSAFDAVIATAAALATALAALTLLWAFGIGHSDWGALWPAAASIWQLGNLVPLHVTLPDAYLVQAGVAADAASFTLSLAPLAFATFTVIFGARSGARAAGATSWVTGVLSGAVAYTAIAAGVALTTRNAIAQPVLWQAILFPALLHAAAALVGAIATAWRDGDDGIVDRVHDAVDAWRGDWAAVPGLAIRGAGAALAGLVGLGALVLAVALFARGGEVMALYEAGQVDALGATLVTLGELLYLPTLVVWGLSWVAGPGFALGPGTAVSPSGTQLGVVPGIPILGAIPASLSPWLLLVLLLPVGVGAIAGWIVRSRLLSGRPASARGPAAPSGAWGTDASPGAMSEHRADHEPVGPRVVLTVAIAVLSGAGAALLAVAASGSMGPGRLAVVGPAAGPLALAVGLEVLVGAGILLLSPRRATDGGRSARDAAPASAAASSPFDPLEGSQGERSREDAAETRGSRWGGDAAERRAGGQEDADATAPIAPIDPTTLGAGRPTRLPPLD